MSVVVYSLVETIIVWISLLILVTLSIQHSIKAHKFKLSNGGFACNIYSVFFFSFVILFFGLALCLFGTFHAIYHNILHGGNTAYCYTMVIFLLNVYTTFKATLYIGLAFRLKQSFKGAFVVYSNHFYSFWIVLIICLAVLLQVLFVMTFDWRHYAAINGRCEGGQIPIFIYAAFVLNDLFCCGVNLYLFIRPLCSLTKRMDSGSKVLVATMRTMRTNAVLGSVSTMSTVMVWFILILSGGSHPMIYINVDCVVSSVCVLLLFQWNQQFRDKLCFCCSKWMEVETDSDMLELQTPNDANSTNSTEVTMAEQTKDEVPSDSGSETRGKVEFVLN